MNYSDIKVRNPGELETVGVDSSEIVENISACEGIDKKSNRYAGLGGLEEYKMFNVEHLPEEEKTPPPFYC